jgi:hypothetical protein
MNTKRVNRTAHVIAAVLISPALCMPARAETLRCGNALIKTEHTADYVLGKCGPPSSKEKITRPVYATPEWIHVPGGDVHHRDLAL